MFSTNVHVEYEHRNAHEAARLLRGLDDKVREAVLKHYKNADLHGSAGRITAAVHDYQKRLADSAAKRPLPI